MPNCASIYVLISSLYSELALGIGTLRLSNSPVGLIGLSLRRADIQGIEEIRIVAMDFVRVDADKGTFVSQSE